MTYTVFEDLSEPAGEDKSRSVPVEVTRTTDTPYRRWGKRVFDLVLLALLLPIAIPLLLIVCFVTALDGSPPIYGQPRVGRDGRIFRMWKIRTMVPDADAALKRLIESDEEIAREWRANQKLRNDPRITSLGRAMRALSIDELPQLVNVLTGHMSFIGPRPFTPDQREIYEESGCPLSYYNLRPGISGLWQVQRRSEGAFGDRVVYDQLYDQDLSFRNDLSIVWQTLAVVARATGR